jgi:hypothetical protein
MNELYFFFFLFRLNDRELCIGPVTHDNFVVTTHETKRNEKSLFYSTMMMAICLRIYFIANG